MWNNISKIHKDRIIKCQKVLKRFLSGFSFNEIYDISFEKIVHFHVRDHIKPKASHNYVLVIVMRGYKLKKALLCKDTKKIKIKQ